MVMKAIASQHLFVINNCKHDNAIGCLCSMNKSEIHCSFFGCDTCILAYANIKINSFLQTTSNLDLSGTYVSPFTETPL